MLRTVHTHVLIPAAMVAGSVLASTATVHAIDNEQFCKGMMEIARLSNTDRGNWIDRNTRDDGIEVLCDIRTVNHKRFVRSGSGGQPGEWKARKQQDWDRFACNSLVLREAVEAGWNIVATITAASGERIIVIATCGPGSSGGAVGSTK